MISQEEFQQLLPLAIQWAEEQEKIILEQGVALPPPALVDAKIIGVLNPEKVRLLCVPEIPIPDHPVLKQAALATGLISSSTIGLTLRYGIFIHEDHWLSRGITVHELAHTAQYERLGGVGPFLKQYLYECITIGYPEAPMEQEAIFVQQKMYH